MDEEIKSDPEINPSDLNGTGQKSELESAQQKADEYLNNWKRERADFINYKNEEIKRIGMLAQYTKEETILKMLPILDSIYFAATAVGGVPSEGGKKFDFDEWFKGFMQITKQIDAFLQKEGIEKIEVIDKPFDPNTMEAVEEVDVAASAQGSGEPRQPGIVVEEVQKGFKLEDRVLRPAKVRISK